MIAVNLTAVGIELVGGTTRYAVSLFEAMVKLAATKCDRLRIVGYVQAGAEHHFSVQAQCHIVPLPRLPSRTVRALYVQTILPYLLRRQQVSVLINPVFTGPVFAVQTVVTILHDLYFHTIPQLVEPRRRNFLKLMVPRMVRASTAVIAISEHTAREARTLWPKATAKIHTVHSAGRELPNAAPLRRGEPFVLFVGAVLPHKNVDCIIASLSQLQAHGTNVRCLHIGADPQDLLAASVRKHDASQYVESIGSADDALLASAYKGALALVVASYTEGFCLPILEAQGLGVPVCATRRGAIPEVAGNSALYFDPDNPAELARHIKQLLDSSEQAADMAIAGKSNAARFSWERTAAGVLEHALAAGVSA